MRVQLVVVVYSFKYMAITDRPTTKLESRKRNHQVLVEEYKVSRNLEYIYVDMSVLIGDCDAYAAVQVEICFSASK